MTENRNLERLAEIVAEWAKPLPICRAYIFGSQVRGDARPDSDLDLAIDYSLAPSDDEMQNWERQNASDFACLKKALGIRLSLHTERSDVAWPAIRKGAEAPVLTVGKVYCVITPAGPKATR